MAIRLILIGIMLLMACTQTKKVEKELSKEVHQKLHQKINGKKAKK